MSHRDRNRCTVRVSNVAVVEPPSRTEKDCTTCVISVGIEILRTETHTVRPLQTRAFRETSAIDIVDRSQELGLGDKEGLLCLLQLSGKRSANDYISAATRRVRRVTHLGVSVLLKRVCQ